MVGSTCNDRNMRIEVELIVYGNSQVFGGGQIRQQAITKTVLRVWNYVETAYLHRKTIFKDIVSCNCVRLRDQVDKAML